MLKSENAELRNGKSILDSKFVSSSDARARTSPLDKLAGQNGRTETARGMPRIVRIVSGTLSARIVRTPRPQPVFRNRKTVLARVAQVRANAFRLHPTGSEVRRPNQ